MKLIFPISTDDPLEHGVMSNLGDITPVKGEKSTAGEKRACTSVIPNIERDLFMSIFNSCYFHTPTINDKLQVSGDIYRWGDMDEKDAIIAFTLLIRQYWQKHDIHEFYYFRPEISLNGRLHFHGVVTGYQVTNSRFVSFLNKNMGGDKIYEVDGLKEKDLKYLDAKYDYIHKQASQLTEYGPITNIKY